MRFISPAAQAALAGEVVTQALLVEMMLSQPVRLCSANLALTYGGNEYIGTGTLGSVGVAEDSPGEYKNLTFSLSGVALDVVSLALQENARGKRVTVRLATIDPSTATVLDAPIIWAGTIDQMPIQAGKETASVNVSAEHRGVTFGRAKPLNYTDVDQQRLYPGDTFLRFIQAQSTHQDVWPAAAWFKQ